MRIVLFIFYLLPINLLAAESTIITSIRPLQSIIANLTKYTDNNIELIIDHNESLHNYHLKPTKIRELHNSKLVIIIDRNFEVFLNKILDNLDHKKQQVIEVAKFPGLKLQKNVDLHHHHHHHHVNSDDYHLWLDIDIIKIISEELVKLLSEQNPIHKKQYQKNLTAFISKLDDLDQRIKSKIIVAQGQDFIVTHNAYQYFINRYDLNNPKSITIDHDHNIGAKSFLELQHSIKENKVKCIFEEPQFESQIMHKLKQDSQVKIGKLDAEWGPNDMPIEDAYFAIMDGLTDDFVQCLK